MSTTALPSSPSLLLHSALTLARRGSWPALLPERRFAEVQVGLPFLQHYHELFGQVFHPDTALLTALYPVAQRAQLALMLDRSLPFPLPGCVHLGNSMTQLAAMDWLAPFALTVQAEQRQHPGGSEQLALTVVFQQGQTEVLRCDSSYLVKRGKVPLARQRVARPSGDGGAIATWSIAPQTARRYAAISGDWNPIHLHPLTARLFGASAAMAHGMYLAGRVCADLQQRHGALLQHLQLEFRKPVLLPATDLAVHCDGKRWSLQRGARLLADGDYRLAD